ncbi:MAG: peptidoglycan-associated lipoprotein Pal [Phenylobacterium sp.]|nr:peptidoglycan-associated lipoprotein Pal [Phenylobacterium sp.]
MKSIAILAAGAAALTLTACASKPKPEPVAPVSQAPAPPPVAEAPPLAPPAAGYSPGSQADLAATAGERVYFGFDRYDLTGEARATLAQQAAWLARHSDVRVRIAGHADERGTREYNLALGARRAGAVRAALIGQGVASNRIETISFGKEQPLDPASNEDAWARNRNGHTVVIGFGEP